MHRGGDRGRAGLVWAYTLAWFLVNDRVKLAAYRWLDRYPRPSDGSLDGYLYFHLGEEPAFHAVPFHEAPQ